MNDNFHRRRLAVLNSYKEQNFENLNWWISEVENCADLLDNQSGKDIFVKSIFEDALQIEFSKISRLLQNLSEDERAEKICEIASQHILQSERENFKRRMDFAKHPLCEIIPKLKRVLLEIRDFFSNDLSHMRFVLERFIQIRQEIQNSKNPTKE